MDWRIRPMWFNTLLFVASVVAFAGASLLAATEQRDLTIKDAYIQVTVDGVVVLTGLYFLFLHYVSVEASGLVQHRWCGLGNRVLPFASITEVTERSASNFYGATIRTYLVKTERAELKLSSAIYWPRDLRRLMQLLRDRGVPVSAGVARHLKLDTTSSLHWRQ